MKELSTLACGRCVHFISRSNLGVRKKSHLSSWTRIRYKYSQKCDIFRFVHKKEEDTCTLVLKIFDWKRA